MRHLVSVFAAVRASRLLHAGGPRPRGSGARQVASRGLSLTLTLTLTLTRYWKVQFTSVKLPRGDERGGAFDELLLALCAWRGHRTLGPAESSAACA